MPGSGGTPISSPRQPAEPVHPGGTNVEHILLLLRQATGVDFAKYKANTIGRRIARRMLLQRTERLEQYVSSLQDNPAEVEALYQDLLIGVTGFFRNPDAFEALKKSIFRELTKHRSADEPLRVWVCGCSTGEEAYSIAMAFLEFAEALPTRVSIQVFATDINERAIGQARRGRYPKTVAHDLSPERLRRFFAETDGGYLIGRPVRDLCVFAKHNVLSDPPFSRIDLISCRNLLIYLEPVLQKQIVPLLHYALRPTGFLWLGASEGVGAFSNLFAPLDKKHRMYSKKPAPAQPTLDIAAGGPPTSLATVGKRTNIVGEGLRSSFDPQEEADRLILARYAPAAVVINAELEILQARGDTSQYLQLPPGKATLNVLHLARADFSGVLRMAIHQAMNQQVPVRKEGLPTASPGQSGALNLEVVPLTGTSPQQRYFLVLFLPTAPPAAQDSSVTTQAVGRAASSRRGAKDREIVRLRQELAATEVQDQQGRWYQLQVRPYRTLDNKIDGAVVVLFDIDLLKQSWQRIEDAREAAEAAVRLRDEFLSIAAHELRTPLTTLSAHSQIALRRLQRDGDLDREELLQSLEAVRHQTDGLALLITRLMDVSRIESGRLPLELEQADLTALVESVAARARVRTSRHAISVKAPRSVRALFDPLRLEQVLTNLLDNAIKYGAEDGPIELVLSKPARGRVELAVRDHGAGIPPEKRGQIFERFYQADEGLHKGGMGLGLYVSRQIVELHGGRLLAEFPKDGGARFIVRLPTRIRRREAVGGTKALR